MQQILEDRSRVDMLGWSHGECKSLVTLCKSVRNYKNGNVVTLLYLKSLHDDIYIKICFHDDVFP